MKGVQSVSLVKEQSNPKIYLVVGDTRFWVTDPAEFDALGLDWSKLRTVDDGALQAYVERLLHPPVATRPSQVFIDCGTDYFSVDPPGQMRWNCQSSANLVRRDVLLAGWLNMAEVPYVNFPGPAQLGIEDLHYDMTLDAVFIDRMYGPSGLSTLLLGASWPGNPSASPVSFGTGPPRPGGELSAVLGSFTLPQGQDKGSIHVELNAWHVDDTGAPFQDHLKGRGTPPAGWINPYLADQGAYFPFTPWDPDGRGVPLKTGDYVVMRGVLWEDGGHPQKGSPDLFLDPVTAGKNGTHEIHPPDWIIRVAPPPANLRLTPAMVTMQTGPGVTTNTVDLEIVPEFTPGPGRTLRVRTAEYLVDPVTFGFSGDIVTTPPQASPPTQPFSDFDHVSVHVSAPTAPLVLFKADWLVGWSEVGALDGSQPFVNDGIPAGAGTQADGGDSWTWTTSNVFFGTRAHVSALASGEHQHWFQGAAEPMTVAASDTLFAMVYLDPDAPPDEVMIQWHALPDMWCRAYWGDDLIGWGTDGTPGRQRIGPLPPTGEWVRLEVPASALALGGGQASRVDGMAFTLYGGSATWDYAGVTPPSPPPPPPPPAVPDVVNKTAAQAGQALRAAGFAAQERFTKDPDGKHLGIVVSQSPPAGTATVDATVTIYIGTDSV